MENVITILIVDDNRFMRETLSFLISHEIEFELTGEAKSGEEAIRLNTLLTPDIILMDINMSPVNGFDTSRRILKERPSTKIIGISVHREISYADQMILLGGKGYITKSSPRQEIIHAIKEVYQNKNYISEDVVIASDKIVS